MKNLNDHIKEIEKEFEHLYYNDLRGEEEPMQVEIFEKFLRSKLKEIATATLAAQIDNWYCCKYQTIKPDDFCDACLAAISEQKKKTEEWLNPKT